jgi:hypothetical protein
MKFHPFIYGGSKPNNAKELSECPTLTHGLVVEHLLILVIHGHCEVVSID